MVLLDWPAPPATLSVGSADVHVWLISLDPPPAKLEALAAFLSAEEVVRANRFRFMLHRERFIAARGQLRTILSR